MGQNGKQLSSQKVIFGSENSKKSRNDIFIGEN
jgi:hypothetical protein